MAETVFVSGASGYIAQHLVKQLLEKGYKVVGTVRSESKGAHLASLFQTPNFSYEIVPDIGPEGAFDEALKKHPEVTVFYHTASPFHFQATNPEEELLKPAVNGTKNALTAIAKYGPNIRKVVITSSYGAIGTAEKENVASYTTNEDTWNEVTWDQAKSDPILGYRGSKKFAEKAAWEFVETQKPNFELNVINPSYLFGPQAFDSEALGTLNTSSEIINGLLNLPPGAEVPETRGGFVDVRDAAKAHIVAAEKDIKNQRFLVNTDRFTAQDMVDIMNKRFESLRGKIAVGNPGAGKAVREKMCKVDNAKTRRILDFEFRDLETTVYDTVKQILDAKAKL